MLDGSRKPNGGQCAGVKSTGRSEYRQVSGMAMMMMDPRETAG